MEKFRELKYERLNIGEVRKRGNAFIKAFAAAESYEEAKRLYLELSDALAEVETTVSIAYVRNTMDTSDSFYDAEEQFYNKSLPLLVPMTKKINKLLLSSRFRPDFEAEFGKQMFVNPELEEKTTSTSIMLDMVKESQLVTRYSKLVALCKTEYMGQECNFYGLLKFMQDDDREVRRGAMAEFSRLYAGVADELDEIYTKLVKVRCKMAKKLGFSSYTELAYLKRRRTDYTAEDVAEFRRQVREYVVPACAKLYEIQAKRIGADKLRYYDESYKFSDGNPAPVGGSAEMVPLAKRMYNELSPETGEFFEFMCEHELFDLETRTGKRMGGYCTSFPSFKAPFIFSNFNGTTADIDVLTHEAGHAFEYFTASRCQPLSAYEGSTSEINEIHSMAMEHFTYPWMKLFVGEKDEAKHLFAHLSDALCVIPYLVSVDEFQHRVFEKPDMTAAERRAAWSEIERIYMPWRDYDGDEFLSGGGFWMQKQHIFMYPFYYVDYALAQTCAFELYIRSLSDRNAAWQDYMTLCRLGGSRGYFELLDAANLANPFKDGTVKAVVEPIMAELAKSEYFNV